MFFHFRALGSPVSPSNLVFPYFSLLGHFLRLPRAVVDPDAMAAEALRLVARHRSPRCECDGRGRRCRTTIPIDGALVKDYNDKVGAIAADLRDECPSDTRWQRWKMALFFATRFLALAAALSGRDDAVLLCVVLLSAPQLLILPYSLFSSVGFAVALAPLILVPPVVASYALSAALGAVRSALGTAGWAALGDAARVEVAIDARFAAAFCAADFAWCCYVVFAYRRSAWLGWRRVAQSALYGNLNSKAAYTLPLLAVMGASGCRVDLAVWALDAVFGVTRRVGEFLSRAVRLGWAPLFYHAHRLAHLPGVYGDAHRYHHYLHDTLAFDAHMYGSGAPEQLLCLLWEFFCALVLGVTPPTLNPRILYLSYDNCLGHNRFDPAKATDGSNSHADHHTYHRLNLGILGMHVDMIFGTCTNNDRYPLNENVEFVCNRDSRTGLVTGIDLALREDCAAG